MGQDNTPFYCLCPEGFTGLICNETEKGTCPGSHLPCHTQLLVQPGCWAQFVLVGSGPQLLSRWSASISLETPHATWEAGASLTGTDSPTPDPSWLQTGPGSSQAEGREGRDGRGRRAGSRVCVEGPLGHLLLPVSIPGSFLIPCPPSLPLHSQVLVFQTPAVMMPNARWLTTRTEGTSSPSTSASALMAIQVSTVRPVSIWGACSDWGGPEQPRPCAGLIPCLGAASGRWSGDRASVGASVVLD